MKSSFLPKYEQKIVRISALFSEGKNPDNFLFVFWEKRWHSEINWPIEQSGLYETDVHLLLVHLAFGAWKRNNLTTFSYNPVNYSNIQIKLQIWPNFCYLLGISELYFINTFYSKVLMIPGELGVLEMEPGALMEAAIGIGLLIQFVMISTTI